MALYFPPRSRDPREQNQLTTAVNKVHDFAHHVMSCLPSRTTPIIAMDLNDGLGRCHGPRGLSNIV
eukprot:2333553-Pyramimonas_sp.AAC.1